MPAAFVFKVNTRSGLTRDTWAGPALHAIFLARVAALDPALAQRLHDDRGPKSYVLSDLVPDGEGGTLWRWVALDESTREVALALAMQGPWQMAPLGVTHEVHWEPEHPWAGSWSYESLRAAEGRRRRYELFFPAVTAFKVDGQPCALPTPRLLLASALQRWNTYAPFQLASEIANLIDPLLLVETAEILPARVRAGNKVVRGFTGRLGIAVSRRASPELAQVAHCLLLYLTLCGAGMKTAMGLGSVVLSGSPLATLRPVGSPKVFAQRGGEPSTTVSPVVVFAGGATSLPPPPPVRPMCAASN